MEPISDNEHDLTRSALLRASTPPSDALFSTLITANHILHFHNVVDAYGHISVRNPQNPETFFISKSLAPALVSSRADIEEYYVSDASPVNEGAPKGYIERFIHSEAYKKYKDVNVVIHSHSEAVIPFSIGSVPLRPVFHMAAVMGAKTPVYDIALHYRSSDTVHSLLVDNEHLGAALAAGFSPTTLTAKATSMVRNLVTSGAPEALAFPTYPTVLMRGHGFTCVANSIEEAVYRAMFTCTNARIQTTALLMQGSFNVTRMSESMSSGKDRSGPGVEDIKYLSERECTDAWTVKTFERPWKLWVAEVTSAGLYKNELGSPPGA